MKFDPADCSFAPAGPDAACSARQMFAFLGRGTCTCSNTCSVVVVFVRICLAATPKLPFLANAGDVLHIGTWHVGGVCLSLTARFM